VKEMRAKTLNRTIQNMHLIIREDAKFTKMTESEILADTINYLIRHEVNITDYMKKEIKELIKVYKSIAKKEGTEING
jgi:hypothetical protein